MGVTFHFANFEKIPVETVLLPGKVGQSTGLQEKLKIKLAFLVYLLAFNEASNEQLNCALNELMKIIIFVSYGKLVEGRIGDIQVGTFLYP